MVAKPMAGQKRENVKVGKLKINKETVRGLSKRERKAIKGGQVKQTRVEDCSGFACPILR